MHTATATPPPAPFGVVTSASTHEQPIESYHETLQAAEERARAIRHAGAGVAAHVVKYRDAKHPTHPNEFADYRARTPLEILEAYRAYGEGRTEVKP